MLPSPLRRSRVDLIVQANAEAVKHAARKERVVTPESIEKNLDWLKKTDKERDG